MPATYERQLVESLDVGETNVGTHTEVPIGTADADRIVVVAVATRLTSASINSCTIDYGTGAQSMNAGSQGNQGDIYARTFYLTVPTGEEATIAVTYGDNPSYTQNVVVVYSIYDAVYSSGGSDSSSDMDSTDPLTTGSVTIGNGGLFLAVASSANSESSKSWTNATDEVIDEFDFRVSVATSTNLGTVTVACTGSTNDEDGALSWLLFNDLSPSSISPSLSASLSPSASPSSSPSSSLSPSASPSISPSSSLSPSASPSISPSLSASLSPSISSSISPSESSSASLSPSKSPSESPSSSPSRSPSLSPSRSPSESPSLSPSVSPSAPPDTFIIHLVYYSTPTNYLHQVSYSAGDLRGRLHTISWTTEGQKTHLVSYEAISATSSSRFHEVSYSASSLVVETRLHEILYSSSSFNTATNFHTVSYASFAPILLLHEILYQSVVEASILHEQGWKADTEQRKFHETRYRVVDTSAIIDAGLITVGDGGLTTYDFMEISITADEDSSYWQCEMTLKDAEDYIRFPRDTAFVIRLFDVDFNFIVDSRSLQRSIDDQGNYQETCTITGLSPLVVKSRPRADRLTKTWDTPIMASAVVTELLGVNTWGLVDWMIPAYRLAAERADPLSVAKQVVEAVGGLIESEPGGGIICRHRWPTSIAGLDEVVVDQELDERVIYSASESPTQDELIDRVRIYDSEAGFQDRLEYVANKIGENDDPRNGILYAFISPWREGLRIVTTRPSVISVGAATEGTRSISDSNEDYPAETITFTERTSSTSYPIMTLTSLDWLDEDLGAAVYTPYATTIEAGNGSYGGYSLAKVEYVTRYLAIPIRCAESVEEIEAQFLLLETQNG